MTEKKSFIHRVRKFFKWWVIVIIVLLVVARLLLPFFVLKYVNKELHAMKGYDGHVEDIDIWLIRGAYVIEDIHIWEINNEIYSRDSFPFFKANAIDLAVDWGALFHGSIVGKVKLVDPVINFKKKKVDSTNIKSDTADFRELVRKIMPLTINYFKIRNGQIHYMDGYSSPALDVKMTDVYSTATNLSNARNKDTLLPSRIVGSGKLYGGTFGLDVHVDILNKQPTFDMNAELKGMQLPQVNDFLRAYTNVDVTQGEFGVYTEFAARNGEFKGYVKPLLKDLKMVEWDDKITHILWESLISGVAYVLTNHPKDQLGTKVDIEGKFNDPNIGIWTAIKYVIVNAYIQALKPSIDNTININNATQVGEKKSLFKQIFGKKDKEKDKH